MEGNKQNKTGFSFADDLMVDITGALFPGLLFIVVLIIAIIIPFAIYDNSHIFSAYKDVSGSLWWVILIVLLIISYVIGHAFFRADIIEPDKRDIKRRVYEELHKSKKKYERNPSYCEAKAELMDQINAFKSTLRKYNPNRVNSGRQGGTDFS